MLALIVRLSPVRPVSGIPSFVALFKFAASTQREPNSELAEMIPGWDRREANRKPLEMRSSLEP